jgi:hypothetical protein
VAPRRPVLVPRHHARRWVRDIATGEERPLTTDGTEYFGYAIDNAGWRTTDRAMVAWSLDSKKIATQRQDERDVREMYLVPAVVGHPTLRVSKFPLPGDSVMAMLHRVVMDVDAGTITRLRAVAGLHHRSAGSRRRLHRVVCRRLLQEERDELLDQGRRVQDARL